ncbi:MAG TPA: nitroreductase/quinone reductase family protein [Candidatus Dormibacteraeota bacterium]|nr:nitroreductase/quinone reductase family protein [Candidatus Dormibacteraeota bacterium]
MSEFSQSILEAAAQEREVQFTTYGRKTGKTHRTTIWVSGDGARLFIRSGLGLGRDWPKNLLARGHGVLHLGGVDVPVQARHVTDPGEARSVSGFVIRKYGSSVQRSPDGGPLTPAEQATFELRPAP